MAELVWDGKYVDGVRREPSRMAPEIATEEVFGDGSLREMNRLVWGDKAEALPALLRDYAGRVDLAYIDPPFETGSSFEFLATIPGSGQGVPRIALPAFRDARGLDAWIAWFSDTVVLLHDLLAEGGSLYVHLDAHAAHYAKIVLDEVFGTKAFQREIIWRIGWVSGFKSRARSWIRNHDTLLFFAKGGRPKTFHKEYLAYAPGYVRRDGKPPKGAGHPIDDVWNGSEADRLDSIQIVSFSGEKVGYPTQKNEALLSRIVRASSSQGDLVLDCFVGSGTTAVVAEKLGRRWIASDASALAVHATRKRLLGLTRAAPFAVQRTLGSGPDPHPRATALVRVRACVTGPRVAIELTDFRLESPPTSRAIDATIRHWSQWIEGWCVDWDYQSGPLRAGVGGTTWRSRSAHDLELVASHTYDGRGPRRILVRAFDVMGGRSSALVDVEISANGNR